MKTRAVILLLALVVSAQTAWLSSPLAVIGPTRPPEVRRLMVGAIDESQRFWLSRVAAASLIVPAIGYFAKLWTGLESIRVPSISNRERSCEQS